MLTMSCLPCRGPVRAPLKMRLRFVPAVLPLHMSSWVLFTQRTKYCLYMELSMLSVDACEGVHHVINDHMMLDDMYSPSRLC
jgi:hypothetical protein